MAQVIDYSWARPSTDGYVGVMRYLAHKNDAKKLTPDEANDLRSRGLILGVVWETTAGRPKDGYDAGVEDAREAERQAADCGCYGAIYFAVDYDETDPSRIKPYFDGVGAVLDRSKIGAYGSARVVGYLLDEGAITYAWQTIAWSGGAREDRAHLYQRVFAGDYDVNDVLRDDWHGIGAVPEPPPRKTIGVKGMFISRKSTGHVYLWDGRVKFYVENGEQWDIYRWTLAVSGVQGVHVTSPWPDHVIDRIPEQHVTGKVTKTVKRW